MPIITFVEHDGTEHRIEAEAGHSLMKVALANDIPGIIGDCGGQCACATCHIYIDPRSLPRVGAASGEEADMLECAIDPAPNSRLSCQIEVGNDLDGLIVRIPASQL